jgi:hypothetical protein
VGPRCGGGNLGESPSKETQEGPGGGPSCVIWAQDGGLGCRFESGLLQPGLTAIILRLAEHSAADEDSAASLFVNDPALHAARNGDDLSGDMAGQKRGCEHDDLPRDVLGLCHLAQGHRARDACDLLVRDVAARH